MKGAIAKTIFQVKARPTATAPPTIALTALSLLLSGIIDAGAQSRFGQITYTTQSICESARILSGEECRNAFVNANAELGEKAPRFEGRGECERYFHRCMIGDIGGVASGGKAKPRVTFIPALKAISISGGSTGEREVLPVVEGDDVEGLFQVRAISHIDSAESGAKTRQAQAAWTQRLAAQLAPPAPVDPAHAPAAGESDSEPKVLDPACASLVDAFAYNACLARAGSKLPK